MNITETKYLSIADHGQVVKLSYQGLQDFHKGDSWFGCSVAFRALQYAGTLLSDDHLWDRQELFVESYHPGEGVRDAIEYVTHCINENRFKIHGNSQKKCSRDMKFKWIVHNENQEVIVCLREGFVPEKFFDLLDRFHTDNEHVDDLQLFNKLKNDLSQNIWNQSLSQSFHVNYKIVSTESDVSSHA